MGIALLEGMRPLPWIALALALAAPAAAQTQRFSAQLTVREREVLIDLPDKLEGKSIAPGAFRVLVDGQPREVTRAEPMSAATAAGEAPWTIVVYVDRVLARPGTVFYSTLTLSRRAAELTRLGSVEVVVADSDPRPELAATRDARPLARTLTDLAAAARVERDREEGLPRAPGPLEPPRLRRQLDKLAGFLAARAPHGPHAVLLVADGLDLPPGELASLDSAGNTAGATAGAGTPAAALQRAARLLAAYGWVAIPIPLRKEGAGVQLSTQTDVERFREGAGPSSHQNGVPPVLPFKPPKASALAFPKVIDLLVAPQTAALRALSRPTAGTVIGYEEQLGFALDALSRRWRLWVAEPDAPVAGRVESLAVSLPGRLKEVRSPAWVRSSTPPEIAEIRLEGLLAGQAEPAGGLPLSATMAAGTAGRELRLELAPVQLPPDAPDGPVRVSWAWSGPEGAVGIHHETVPAGDLARGWRHTVPLAPPPGARRLAVVVEALGPERWGGAILEIE